MIANCFYQQDAANLIHQENVNIFSIGVGNGINTNELKLIASSPQNVYTVTNFDALHKIQDVLQKTACEGTFGNNILIFGTNHSTK